MQTVMPFAVERPPVRLARRSDGWWVTGLPDERNQEIGPYATKAEADDARRGMVQFFTRHPSYADWPMELRGKRGGK